MNFLGRIILVVLYVHTLDGMAPPVPTYQSVLAQLQTMRMLPDDQYIVQWPTLHTNILNLHGLSSQQKQTLALQLDAESAFQRQRIHKNCRNIGIALGFLESGLVVLGYFPFCYGAKIAYASPDPEDWNTVPFLGMCYVAMGVAAHALCVPGISKIRDGRKVLKVADAMHRYARRIADAESAV